MRKLGLCLTVTLSAGLLSFSSPSAAKDLGVHGTVFPIKEPDMLAQIEARLRHMERTGELAAKQEEFKQRAINKAEEPPAVEWVTKAYENRSWLHDPSVILQQDLRDADGRVFATAGTRVNPLEVQPFKQILLFVQGSDEQQVQWAFDQLDAAQGRGKIILVDGRPLDLMRKHKRQVFFDQNGFLVGKLGIQHVPASVKQEGLALRIDETAL